MLNEKHRVYYILGGSAIVGGILCGYSQLIFLGWPFILMAFLPLLWRDRTDPQLEISCFLDHVSLTEGETLRVTLHIKAATAVALVEITHILQGPGFDSYAPLQYYLSLNAGESRTVVCDIKLDRRGRYVLNHLRTRFQDEFQLVWVDGAELTGQSVLVYPSIGHLKLNRGLMRRIGTYSGNYVSKFAGEGTELAEIRQYHVGDMAKHINWKVSLRRAGFGQWPRRDQEALSSSACSQTAWGSAEDLYVNARLQERNADIVLIIDALRNPGIPPNSYLDLAARGAASLAHYFLGQKDRVGLIEYHGTVSWLQPASGQRQMQRILERLAVLQEAGSYVFRELDEIPRRALPASAQLFVFTPLLDARSMRMLVSLALCGFRPLVVYIPLLGITGSGFTETVRTSLSPLDQLSLRWWRYEQNKKLWELRRCGLVVMTWDGSQPIDSLLMLTIQPLLLSGRYSYQ